MSWRKKSEACSVTDRNVCAYYCEESFRAVNLQQTFYKFARAGFYLSDENAQCFSCGLRIENWINIHNPLLIHAAESPFCKFILKEINEEQAHDIFENFQKNRTEKSQCKICYDRTIDKYLINCGHTICTSCVKKCRRCPFCSTPI